MIQAISYFTADDYGLQVDKNRNKKHLKMLRVFQCDRINHNRQNLKTKKINIFHVL